MIQWIQRFESVQQIRREDLDDALREDLQISKAQMDKFKKEFEKQKMKLKDKEFSKETFFRMLLEYLKPNSEYDIVTVIQRLQTMVHVEVKSMSIDQAGVTSDSETGR